MDIPHVSAGYPDSLILLMYSTAVLTCFQSLAIPHRDMSHKQQFKTIEYVGRVNYFDHHIHHITIKKVFDSVLLTTAADTTRIT